MSFPRKLAGFRRLCAAERRLLIGIAWRLPVVAGCLRLFGFKRTQSWIRRTDLAPAILVGACSDTLVAQASRMAAAAVQHLPFGVFCLPRSMALQWVLLRYGVQTSLRLGVALDEGSLDAHAWIEYRGKPVLDPPLVSEHFAPFAHSFDSKAKVRS
jgi:hypothetical protein